MVEDRLLAGAVRSRDFMAVCTNGKADGMCGSDVSVCREECCLLRGAVLARVWSRGGREGMVGGERRASSARLAAGSGVSAALDTE